MRELRFEKDLNLLLKKVSRTLYLSVSILPEYVKSMLGIGYLICRAMDTVVDSSNLEAREKRELLNMFKNLNLKGDLLFEKLKKISEGINNKNEKELLEKYFLVYNFIDKLSEKEKRLLDMLLKGVASGMEMDINFFETGKLNAFKTEKDLLTYCQRVGGVPGIYWYEVYNLYSGDKFRDYGAIRYAYDIGMALQLTNILKDLSADLKQNRCYIPYEDLRQANLLPELLLKPENIDRFSPVLNKWIIQTIDRLDSSEKFLSIISKSSFGMRAAVIWPVYWAMDTLYEIVRNNPLKYRNKISKKKIYSTIIKTPSLLVSNSVFQRGYRFRRETLIVAMNSNLEKI